MADPTLKQDILAAGPREVHTPNLRVIAHDPEAIDRIMTKRRMSSLPTMGTIGGSVGIPKKSAYEFCNCNERPNKCIHD